MNVAINVAKSGKKGKPTGKTHSCESLLAGTSLLDANCGDQMKMDLDVIKVY